MDGTGKTFGISDFLTAKHSIPGMYGGDTGCADMLGDGNIDNGRRGHVGYYAVLCRFMVVNMNAATKG